MGIVLFILTTFLVVVFPFIVPYSKEALILVCILSAMGYTCAYLYIDSYLSKYKPQ